MFWGRLFPAGGLLLVLALSVLWAGSRASRVPHVGPSLLPVSTLFSAGALESSRPQIVQSYGQLPLMFEPNVGQTDHRVQFLARGTGYGLFLTGDGAVLSLIGGKSAAERTSSVIRMKCFSRIGTSSLRSRSGGRLSVNAFNR